MVEPAPGALRVARLPWTTDQNPYQWATYAALAREDVHLHGTGALTEPWLREHQGSVHVLHLHWHLERLCRDAPPGTDRGEWVCRQLAAAQRLGYVVAWTIHEPGALTSPSSEAVGAIEQHLLERADVLFVHDEPTAEVVRRRTAHRTVAPPTIAVTPPGDYGLVIDAQPPAAAVLEAARELLDLDCDQQLVLAFGAQRTDKDLSLLIEAFRRLDRDEVVLALVGLAADRSVRDLLDASVGPTIRVVDEFVSETAAAACFALADVAVLARSRDWTSSSLLFAVAHDTPVVTADLPTQRAIVGDAGARWFTPGDSSSLARAIGQVLDDPELATELRRSASRYVRGRTWDGSAAVAARALRAAVGAVTSRVTAEPGDLRGQLIDATSGCR